jgi:hypothetical protein
LHGVLKEEEFFIFRKGLCGDPEFLEGKGDVMNSGGIFF